MTYLTMVLIIAIVILFTSNNAICNRLDDLQDKYDALLFDQDEHGEYCDSDEYDDDYSKHIN